MPSTRVRPVEDGHTTTPANLALTVPEAYTNDFRIACLDQLSHDSIVTDVDDTAKRMADGSFPPSKLTEDLGAHARFLNDVVAVLAQFPDEVTGDVEINADADVIAEICEGVAKLAVDRLTAVLEVTPITGDYAAQTHLVIREVAWAVDNAARGHASRRVCQPE